MGFVLLYALSATYRYPATVDVTNAVLPAYQLGVEGTLDVTPYRDYIESRPVVQEQFVEVDGRWYSGRNPGVIAVAVPVYYLTQPQAETGQLPPLWPGSIAASLVTAGAMALLSLAFRSVLTGSQAIGGALLAGLGTTAWSTASDLLWSHGPAMLGLAAAVVALTRGRFGLAGLAVGAAMTARPELAVSAAVLGIWIAVSGRSWRRLVRFAAGPAISALLLLAYFGRVLGAFSPVAGHRNTGMLASLPSMAPTRLGSDFLAVLAEPRNGLLLFSPFLVFLVPALHKGWRAAEPWMRGAAVAGAAHLALIIVIQGNGDGNFLFGYRFPLEMLVLSSPLLATTWREHVVGDRTWTWLFNAMAGASVLLHGLAAVLEWRR